MKYILLLCCFFYYSCASQSIEQYTQTTPKLDLRQFFDGKVIAKGIVQNRSGLVTKKFTVDMKPQWQENILILDEDFVYDDNSTSKRIWKMQVQQNGEISASAGDVVGKASGKVSGNAFHFHYTLTIDVDGEPIDIDIDDWMYLIDNDTLLARSKMTKWGFHVGDITLVMWKKS